MMGGTQGTPIPGPEMGYPPRPGTDTPPDLGPGTPLHQTWDWVPPPPDLGLGPHPGPGMGYPPDMGRGTPPGQISIASTCYAAGSMPLAFTQEDFLVFLFVEALGVNIVQKCKICVENEKPY